MCVRTCVVRMCVCVADYVCEVCVVCMYICEFEFVVVVVFVLWCVCVCANMNVCASVCLFGCFFCLFGCFFGFFGCFFFLRKQKGQVFTSEKTKSSIKSTSREEFKCDSPPMYITTVSTKREECKRTKLHAHKHASTHTHKQAQSRIQPQTYTDTYESMIK